MFFFSVFFMLIFILLAVAFFTLFERSVLGYIQFRSGPLSVGYLGVFQPFSDGLKLFSSEYYFLGFGNYLIYYFVPILGLMTSMIFWLLYPFFFNMVSFILGLLFFLCCSGLGVYFIMISGWSSNSAYSMLGCMRSVAQSISYEVCFFLIILCLVIYVESFNLIDFYFFQSYIWFFFLCFPLFFVFFSCCLAETNRTPFDFSEGESELVSGFNVEYSSFMFSLFFLSEYSNMMFISFFLVFLFFGGDLMSLIFFIKVLFFLFCFIWVRGSFPRYRYDKLMYMSWKCYLPLVLNYLIYFISLSIFIYYIFFSLLVLFL
uniref:NADH-ubiquinone oxidoreductase chain 1 n=1 Tax=Metcalfa pruinosa TaxID=1185500 RepID=A0A8F2PQQ0_9HEMI|nr:NADH dehydrogenase subunit 1 [Metcalfa pruinosa]QWV61030.1 NADH dehydrogenase subunit 1 [Metcalfa pruinosa]WAR47345.1 NADH dehydrogenase subunit 1 [Metcalfa pruinosa]